MDKYSQPPEGSDEHSYLEATFFFLGCIRNHLTNNKLWFGQNVARRVQHVNKGKIWSKYLDVVLIWRKVSCLQQNSKYPAVY